ncbi:MAG: DUF222 domain-containing protein [Actinomycetota bacterium]
MPASRARRAMFERIAEADRQQAWRESGARDMAHFLSMRYGISCWKASRWIHAAHAGERLSRLWEASGSGLLGIDKVVELTRFPTPETESDLVSWAKGVSVACVRRKADVTARQAIEDMRDAQASRFLSWWYFDDGRRLGLEAELPAAEGAAVVRALEHLAEELPVMPGEENPCHADARRADALVALASNCLAGDSDPDRATVVVHAPLEALVSGEAGCELEGGGLIHAESGGSGEAGPTWTPAAPVHVPPQARSRAGMGRFPRRGRDRRMVPSRRDPLPGSGDTRRTLRTATSSRSRGVMAVG